MIQLPPKKRVPELKLKKLDVTDPQPKRTLAPSLPSVTTVIDGIPIVEYLYDLGTVESEYLQRAEQSPIICLDSGESEPNSPDHKQNWNQGTVFSHHFSPEPIYSSDTRFSENELRTDSYVALKKPTRWDSGPRKSYQLDIRTEQGRREFTADPNFKLQPRDPRVKTFKKHHRHKYDSRDNPAGVTLDENLMDISSPEYNPPSPFGTPPVSPKVAFEAKNKTKGTGFFDSDSECSEVELSRKSSFYEMLTNSVERMPEYSGTIEQQNSGQKMCFWDSSSGEESVNPTRQDLQNIKLNSSSEDPKQTVKKFVIPRRSRGNQSSDDELDTKYSKLESKGNTTRSKSTSSLKETRERQESQREARRSPRVPRARGRSPKNRSSPLERNSDIPHAPRRIHVCIYCGDRGHASNDTCPLRVCSLCFKIGHNFRECSARGKNRPPKCMRCRISCHEKNRCGEIWRQCHNTTFLPNNYPQCAKRNSYNVTMEIQAFRIDQLKSNLYCCNCAKFGHVFFQCEKSHPSRYFHIPLVGHHDIPLPPAFREIRDRVDSTRAIQALLPKPYQVVTQNFWGDGNRNDSSDNQHSAGESSRHANWKSSYKKRGSDSPKRRTKSRDTSRHKPPPHSSDTDHTRDKSPNKPPTSTTATNEPITTAAIPVIETELQEYYKVAFKAYQLAFERANRGNSLYARDILNNRGFITVAPYPVPLEDRRQLAPLVYIPEPATVVQETHITPKEEQTYPPKQENIKSPVKRERQDSNAPHSNGNTNSTSNSNGNTNSNSNSTSNTNGNGNTNNTTNNTTNGNGNTNTNAPHSYTNSNGNTNGNSNSNSYSNSNRKGKLFPNKHRNTRDNKPLYKPRPPKGRIERDKRKFDAKSKRLQKHFGDARECINRNRNMRETERQVRISHPLKSPCPPGGEGIARGGNSSPIGDSSPKRFVGKKERSIPDNQEREISLERLGLKMETINGEQTSESETYLFIEEAN